MYLRDEPPVSRAGMLGTEKGEKFRGLCFQRDQGRDRLIYRRGRTSTLKALCCYVEI